MKKRILVVDEQPVVRNTLSCLLEACGCAPSTAYDGLDALRSFADARREGAPFDAVFLDLGLSGERSALAVLERLRQLDPEVPAIVTSGYADDPVMRNHDRHGFTASLEKPFGPDAVERVLSRVFPS